MSDAAFSQIMSQINDFSYEQKKSLIESLKQSLKPKQKEFKTRLSNSQKHKLELVESLAGLCTYQETSYDNDPRLERIMSKHEKSFN